MRSLTKPECQKWIEALRSGEYLQCSGVLKTTGDDDKQYYCCLGVLCELLEYNSYSKCFIESSNYRDSDLLSAEWQLTLSKMNDDGHSFEKIADHIESRILPKLPDA